MMAKATENVPPPTPIALVICDNVYQERGGKRALVGLFNQITAKSFPARQPKFCVFVSVTSLRPGTICKLDVVNAETGEPVFSMAGPLPANDPTTICDIVFDINGLTFPEAGRYYIRFFGNNIPIVQRPFEVTLLPPSNIEEERENDDENNES